jgi:hypothetical protein
MGCIVCLLQAPIHSEKRYMHRSLSGLSVCLAATVAINRVTRPFEKLSRRSRSRQATKTPWDHDLCPNFQRKVTASRALSRSIHPSAVHVQSFLCAPLSLSVFTVHRADFLSGIALHASGGV